MVKGKWQWNNDKQNWVCSECGREAVKCLSVICPLCRAVMCMPSVDNDNALDEIELQESEEKTTNDLISKDEILKAFSDYVAGGMSMNDFDALWDIVAKMPPVKESKTGHWEWTRYRSIDKTGESYDDGIGFRCSNCANVFKVTSLARYHYCPNCGCKMVDPQESEDINADENFQEFKKRVMHPLTQSILKTRK